MRSLKLCAVAASLGFAVAIASAQQMIGYRGDTTGVFPGANVPANGKVLWKTPMPNWCYGFPIVVGAPSVASTGSGQTGSGQVFCMSEPGWKHVFPVLLAIDAKTGAIQWELELDHLPYTGLPKAKQDELRAEFAKRWQWWRDTWTASGGKSMHESKTKAPWEKEKNDPLQEHGLYAGTWYDWGMSLIGSCFPTPVSDGKAVYVVTGRGTTACVTLDGQIKWLTRIPYADYRGEDCRNARSPLLWNNLLISAAGNVVRACDKATGKELWRVQSSADHTVATPLFMKLGDTEVIYTCNNMIIRLRDGKKLELKGGIGEGTHTPAVNDEDDIIYFTGNGEHCSFADKGKALGMPIAMKFTLQGETVTATKVWEATEQNNEPPLYYAGRVYCGKGIYDARTGKLLAGLGGKAKGAVAAPATRHVLLTDGKFIVGVDAPGGKRDKVASGTIECFTLDGKPAGRVEIPHEVGDPARCKAKMGGDDWGFSNSCPFTLAKGHIYVRAYDYLYCVGAP